MAQRFHGVTAAVGDPVPVIRTDLTASGAYASVRDFLHKSARPPRGLVVGTYGQTAATIRAIVDSGLDIPGDIRVVGFDGSRNDYGQFRLTAAQQPVDVLTRRALSQLLDNSAVSDPIILSLRLGNTCGCPV